MLRFLIGTNEKARRKRLYDEIAQTPGPALLLVPEQFSFESEKLLNAALGSEKAQNVEVLSFSRLCNSVFRRFGGLAGDYSDDTTKLLLMGAALSHAADDLRFYQKTVLGAPFIEKLVETDTILKNAAVTSEDLFRLSDGTEESVLKAKSHDLALIFSHYDALLGESWLDPLTDLSRAAEVLSEHDFFSETPVFLDNFTGFTGSEQKLLAAVLSQSPTVTVSLRCPTLFDKTGGFGLFSKTQRTAGKLWRLADSVGVKVALPVLVEAETDSRPEAIRSLEDHFFQDKNPVETNKGEVRLIFADDAYDEAAFVACEAHSLAESGLRWRDMAIIARDLTPYRHALPDAFAKANIPLYTDEPADFHAHPLAAFLLASLSAVQNRFPAEDVFRLLKTGLLPVDEEAVAEFENYCYIWNIRGSLFLSDFTGNPDGFSEDPRPESLSALPRLNELRRQIVEPLVTLRDSLSSADGEIFSQAVYQYLVDAKVTEGLRRLYDQYFADGNRAAAEDLDTFWTALIGILDKFTSSLSGVVLPLPVLNRLLETALSTIKIGVLPKTLDCVMAGTADRFRPADLKAVFLIGVTEGVFPASPKNGGLFTDSERQTMETFGLELGEGDLDPLLSERMYAYNALTAASEKVFVTVPRYDAAAKALSPSSLVRRLPEAVSPLPEESTADLPETFWLCSEELAFERLAAGFSDETPAFRALFAWFSGKEGWKDRVEKLGKAVKPAELSLQNKGNAEKLFGQSVLLSPSSITNYYEHCPFCYFARSGLSLKERNRARLEGASAGSLIHYILQKLIAKYAGGIAALSEEALRAEIDDLFEEYLQTVLGGTVGKTPSFLYLFRRIADFLVTLLQRVGKELSDAAFKPYAFEQALDDSGEVPLYRLTTDDGKTIAVCGKIDRVDTVELDGVRYVRVVDYKTGRKVLDLNDVYYGINIQMLLYLFAIWQGGKGGLADANPAGILYMPARDTIPSADSAADAAFEKTDPFKMNGLLLRDKAVVSAMEPNLPGVFLPVKEKDFSEEAEEPTPSDDFISALLTGRKNKSLADLSEFTLIRRHIDGLLKTMVTDLCDGKIAALPFRNGKAYSCDFCPYASVCRRTETDPFILHENFSDDRKAAGEGDDEP